MTDTEEALSEDGQRRSILGDLGEILRDLYEFRFLLYQLTLRDVRIRYKQAVMGFGWAVLMPVVVIFSGIVVRIAMTKLSGGSLDTHAVAGVAIKALPWAFFVSAIGFANQALLRNTTLVTKIYFPREVLPLSAVLASAFDALVGVVALTLTLPWLGVSFSTGFLWVPLIGLMLFLFTVGLAMLVSATNLFFRDVKYVVQLLLTFGIFFTPVFFEPTMFGSQGAELMMLNPLAPLLEGLRLAIVEGHNLLEPLMVHHEAGEVLAWTPWYLVYSGTWAVVGTLISALTFHRLEFLFAEYI